MPFQAFSIASNLDPKLMSKVQDQIPMRKVCTLIQPLVSRHPNHHSGYSQDREKHHMLLTLIRKYNIVYGLTNVEQQKLLGTDTSRPLLDVTPERPYPLAVVEGVQSRFFQSTAAAGAVRRVCQARSVSPVAEGQRITGKPPGELFKVSCSRSLSLAPNSIGSESSPATSRVASPDDPKRSSPLTHDTASF